jgi:hypothetical protein
VALLAALTKLATQLKPVTAEGLRSFEGRSPSWKYWRVAVCLGVFIVPFSLASFMTTSITEKIRTDIAQGNALTISLASKLNPLGTDRRPVSNAQEPSEPSGDPALATAAHAQKPDGSVDTLPVGVSRLDVVTELQTYASLTREIFSRSRQLGVFIAWWAQDPAVLLIQDKLRELKRRLASPTGPKTEEPDEAWLRHQAYKETFQLPVPLPPDLRTVLDNQIVIYQNARSFGQDSIDDVAFIYGAVNACILPVLYALLGTCAYLLRSLDQGMRSRTFTPSHTDAARFFIAGIAGGVVGLFSNLLSKQDTLVSPLGIAFIAGYGVDVFFTFLEGLIQAFTKSKEGAGVPSPVSPAASKA